MNRFLVSHPAAPYFCSFVYTHVILIIPFIQVLRNKESNYSGLMQWFLRS